MWPLGSHLSFISTVTQAAARRGSSSWLPLPNPAPGDGAAQHATHSAGGCCSPEWYGVMGKPRGNCRWDKLLCRGTWILYVYPPCTAGIGGTILPCMQGTACGLYQYSPYWVQPLLVQPMGRAGPSHLEVQQPWDKQWNAILNDRKAWNIKLK